MIRVQNLTKLYPGGKGIREISFEVREGEIFGYLGPNAAGKTTTIRNLMGFLKPDQGSCRIGGLHCWKESAEIQKTLGYIPGEIAFLDGMKGTEFLSLLARMREYRDLSHMHSLLERFRLDPSPLIRHMSRGMKQKLAIVAAFLHDPAVLLLDEPTAGLDPLMQRLFAEFLLEEKKRGKTILMSSHNFPEIDRTCDRAGIVKEGRLLDVQDVHALRERQRRIFTVTLASPEEIPLLEREGVELNLVPGNRVSFIVEGEADRFIKTLAKVKVQNLEVEFPGLEEVFLHYFTEES